LTDKKGLIGQSQARNCELAVLAGELVAQKIVSTLAVVLAPPFVLVVINRWGRIASPGRVDADTGSGNE